MDEDTERRWRRARAQARLKALGVDVETMPREQIRRMWESVRASYVNNAQAGLHFEPMRLDGDPLPGACLHARVGVFVDALREWLGEWPADWSHHRIDWPGPGGAPGAWRQGAGGAGRDPRTTPVGERRSPRSGAADTHRGRRTPSRRGRAWVAT